MYEGPAIELGIVPPCILKSLGFVETVPDEVVAAGYVSLWEKILILKAKIRRVIVIIRNS
jgi:hypothetical protein